MDGAALPKMIPNFAVTGGRERRVGARERRSPRCLRQRTGSPHWRAPARFGRSALGNNMLQSIEENTRPSWQAERRWRSREALLAIEVLRALEDGFEHGDRQTAGDFHPDPRGRPLPASWTLRPLHTPDQNRLC